MIIISSLFSLTSDCLLILWLGKYYDNNAVNKQQSKDNNPKF